MGHTATNACGDCVRPRLNEAVIIETRSPHFYKWWEQVTLKAIYDSLSEIHATVQVGVQVSEQVKRILVALGQETLTGNDLMARVGIKHRPTFRKNYLLPAIELGYIEMTIPEKPNSSKQMYRNTNKRKTCT